MRNASFLLALLVVAGCTPGRFAADAGVPPAPVPAPSVGTPFEVVAPSETVAYSGTRKGYLALPPATATGKRPAVVMIHEWWGLNSHIRGQANELAKSGYVVLAVDLFGTVATTTAEAQAQTGKVDAAQATANLKDAVAFLRARAEVDPARVGSLGWCFGGGWSLKLLQAQPDLAVGVMYYGSVVTDPAPLKGLPPLLGIFGAADTTIKATDVAIFDGALATAGVQHAVHVYDGAGHAFANPTGGDRYKPEAAKDAWERTVKWLGSYLKP